MNLVLKDSQFLDGENIKDNNATLFCQAIDKLNSDIEEKRVEFFSFSNSYQKQNLEDKIVWYEINETQKKHSYTIINQATFFTSHFIGFYSTKISDKIINISIKPRFGSKLLDYLISYAYGIYLPKGFSSSSNKKDQSLWLITFMWKALLQKAMTKSQIPKEYKKFSKNLATFKGQLNVSKQIKYNLLDRSKFYCDFRKLTMDTTINQTIVYVYQLLKKEYAGILKDLNEYIAMLQSFGVSNKEVTIREIQNIRYSKLNFHYKKLMELSTLIIKKESKTSNIDSILNDSFAYFIDIAQLWENYLLKVLQRGLKNYYIYSPNERGGESLFLDGSRSVRPDIIIEKDRKIVAILDAKYKWYKQIGSSECEIDCVSRDDLYQMTAYLYHYGSNTNKLIGLFVSPIEQETKDIKILHHNQNHKIGVLNLNIDKLKDKEFDRDTIKQEEYKFINTIKNILDDYF